LRSTKKEEELETVHYALMLMNTLVILQMLFP
jgi:hypothetical protein